MGASRVSRLWALGLVLAVAWSSYAMPVTVNVTGEVTNVRLFPGFSGSLTIPVGAPVTGSYTYDDAATPFLYGNPEETAAWYPLDGFTLTFADTAYPLTGSMVASPAGYLTLVQYSRSGGVPWGSYILYADWGMGGACRSTGADSTCLVLYW
jgi:hypothetical protein